MKKLLLYAIMACTTLTAAATGYDKLNVHFMDGSTMELTLLSELKLSFQRSYLVASVANMELNVPRKFIDRLVHVPAPNAGIKEIVASEGVEFFGNTLRFNFLPVGTNVKLYTVGGVELRSIAAEGAVEINLDDLAAGIYIVRVNEMSYKISVQ